MILYGCFFQGPGEITEILLKGNAGIGVLLCTGSADAGIRLIIKRNCLAQQFRVEFCQLMRILAINGKRIQLDFETGIHGVWLPVMWYLTDGYFAKEAGMTYQRLLS